MVKVIDLIMLEDVKTISLKCYGLYKKIQIPTWINTIAIDKSGGLWGFSSDLIIPHETPEEIWDYPSDLEFDGVQRYYYNIGFVKYHGDWKESKVAV